jgi:hypothetical protein
MQDAVLGVDRVHLHPLTSLKPFQDEGELDQFPFVDYQALRIPVTVLLSEPLRHPQMLGQ